MQTRHTTHSGVEWAAANGLNAARWTRYTFEAEWEQQIVHPRVDSVWTPVRIYFYLTADPSAWLEWTEDETGHADVRVAGSPRLPGTLSALEEARRLFPDLIEQIRAKSGPEPRKRADALAEYKQAAQNAWKPLRGEWPPTYKAIAYHWGNKSERQLRRLRRQHKLPPPPDDWKPQ